MPLTKITGPGLASIALLVAVLWGCIVAQALIVNRAQAETAQAMRELRSLQLRRAQPVSHPLTIPQFSGQRSPQV